MNGKFVEFNVIMRILDISNYSFIYLLLDSLKSIHQGILFLSLNDVLILVHFSELLISQRKYNFSYKLQNQHLVRKGSDKKNKNI